MVYAAFNFMIELEKTNNDLACITKIPVNKPYYGHNDKIYHQGRMCLINENQGVILSFKRKLYYRRINQ